MQPEFWQHRWRTAQIGFHQATVDRRLEAYWPLLNLASESRVFVPLCGKSLDLLWLRDRSHRVTGIELSSLAVEGFCMEHGIPAERRSHGGFDVFEADRLTLICGDFFKLTPDVLGTVEAVYDRASLIALPPEVRSAYVEHITALTHPGTQTLLIAVEYPQAQMNGPPFSVPHSDIDVLYAPHHSIELLGQEDILERESRYKARGLTDMREVCYRLTRL